MATLDELRYETVIDRQLASAENLRKGERTRFALKRATVLALNEIGYRDLRVVDICDRAGVSKATFWVYFEDKVALASEVLSDFMAELRRQRAAPGTHGSAYDAILYSNRLWISNARANGGLMECLLQFSDEVPEFAKIYHESDHELFKRFAKKIARDFANDAVANTDWELTVQVLAAMMDTVTRKLIAPASSAFAETVYALGHDDDSFAEYLTRIWYLALFGREPNPA